MLRVIQPFAGRAVGDEITDASDVEAILDSDQAHFVVRVAEPSDAPALPAPADTKE